MKLDEQKRRPRRWCLFPEREQVGLGSLSPLREAQPSGRDDCAEALLSRAVADPAGELQPGFGGREDLAAAIGHVEQAGKVVVPARRRGVEVVLERELELERTPYERLTFLGTAARGQDRPLRVECVRQQVRQVQSLGCLQRQLDPCKGLVVPTGEHQQPTELVGERGEVGVGLVLGERLERALRQRDPVPEPVVEIGDLAERGRDTRGGVCEPLRLVQLDRLLEVGERIRQPSDQSGHLAGPLMQLCPFAPHGREGERLLEIALPLGTGRERGGPFAGPHEHLARSGADRVRIRRLGVRFARGEVVRGHHLRCLRLLAEALEPRRSRQMPGLPLGSRERLVGDLPEQVLQEAVLAALGRARVGFQAENLLSRKASEKRLELGP